MRGTRGSIDGVKLDRRDRNTLVLTGALTFGSAAHVYAEGARALAAGTQTQLDLAGVTRADSAGLACVIALAAAANRAGRHLRVTHWPEGLHALAEVSDVAPLLESATGSA